MAEEKILNNEPAASQYDDAAEQAKFLEQRAKQHAEDFAQPFDKQAVLEVRHLRKTFPIQKTFFGKGVIALPGKYFFGVSHALSVTDKN